MLVTNSLVKDPRVQREALYASQKGNDVTVIGVSDSFYDKNFYKDLPYNVCICSINQKYREKLKSSYMKFLRFTIPNIKMIKECKRIKPQIIHANDFDTLPAAYIASKLIKSKVVYDSHEIYTGNPALSNKPFIKKVLQLIESFLIRRVKAVCSVSHAAAQKLSEMYNISIPYVVTNCSLYVDEDKLPAKHNRFEVLYQGRITAHRGYEEFVCSASLVPPEVSLLVRGYGEVKEKLKEIIKNNNIVNVELCNPVPISELIPKAAESSVGVILTKPVSDNYKYTVSNKIFECVQARIPVILSDVPEHRYINDKYKIGIIVKDVTPENIAAAIREFYENKAFYKECLENTRKASVELSWEKEGNKLLEIYKETLC